MSIQSQTEKREADTGPKPRQHWQTPLLITATTESTQNGGGHHGDYMTNNSVSASTTNSDVFASS